MNSDPIYITRNQLDAFSRLSRDTNPLHMSEEYARKTMYGQQVVFGILGLLRALSLWSNGRSIHMRRLHAQFKRPLFLQREYKLDIDSVEDGAVLRIMSGSRLQVRIKVEGKLGSQMFDWSRVARENEFKEKYALHAEQTSARVYSLNLDEYDDDLAALGLTTGFLPWEQFTFLLWTSYTVGVENPGEQALYADLRANFTPSYHLQNSVIEIQDLKDVFNDVYRVITLTGRTRQVEAFEIQAFVRPSPIQPDLGAICALDDLTRLFASKRCLVVGGGRGFGAAICLLMKKNLGSLISIQRSSSPLGAGITQYLGDASSPIFLEQVSLEIENESLDYLILNASPTIEAAKFSELSSADWHGFVVMSLSLYLEPLRHFVKKFKDRCKVVCISSVYVQESPTEFSHYVAAKAALEETWRVLAKEFPRYRFLIYRPPKMRTDQTNTVRIDNTLHASEIVAKDLLLWMGSDDFQKGQVTERNFT